MFCVGHKCFRVSCSADLKKTKKTRRRNVHTPPYGPTHTTTANKGSLGREKLVARPRIIVFSLPPNQGEMKRWDGKRDGGGWWLHAVTHQQKGQGGGSCHIVSESAAATPALRAYTLLLGEERRGAALSRKQKEDPSVSHFNSIPLQLACPAFGGLPRLTRARTSEAVGLSLRTELEDCRLSLVPLVCVCKSGWKWGEMVQKVRKRIRNELWR